MAQFNTGPKIYNLFPRLVGYMHDWVQHYDRIAAMGFDWLYINPFHYPGFSGSLYAPKDYYDFNPIFADKSSAIPPMVQLQNAMGEAKKRGIKVMMDLVINHTAKDHPFVKLHPDWYEMNEKGEVKSPGAWDGPNYNEWGDLAEINNANSPDKKKLWAYWKELVEFYIDKGVDGFRADAAYQVPAELWSYLIEAGKKKNKDVRFFAESLGCTQEQALALGEAGFDYLFNSSKYWNFQEDWLLRQYNQTREVAPSIAFPESHDTPRLAYEYQNNIALIKQRIIFTAFFSTGWMVPIGMEFGFKNKTDVVSTYPKDWEEVNYDISGLITGINETRSKYRIFNEECRIEIVHNDNWANIICLLKTSQNGKEKVMIVINKDPFNRQRLFFSDLAGVIGAKPGGKIIDLSFEHPMTDVAVSQFEYMLNPSDIRILYTSL
ncbi:MAG: alpha-amylase [Brevinematales bacterium]|nr:alpha-amylase [Brevinematales bacterium]